MQDEALRQIGTEYNRTAGGSLASEKTQNIESSEV